MLALMGVLLVLSGLVAGAETAVFSLQPAERRRLAAHSASVARAIESPASLLVALLLANLVINVAYFSVSASISFALMAEGRGAFGALVAAVSVVVLVIGGEIVPKTLALAAPAKSVVRVAPLLVALRVALAPFVFVAAAVTGLFERLLFGRRMTAQRLGAADFKSAITSSGTLGVYRAVELALLHDVIDFGERKARNIMVPRVDVVFLDLADSREAWLETMATEVYGVYPVCEGSPDAIVGTVRTALLLSRPEAPRAELIEAPLFAPLGLEAERLVERMEAEDARLAILLDEYGGVAGVVGFSALARSVLGEIAPVAAAADSDIEVRAGGSYSVRGDCPLHSLQEHLGIELATRRADTLGGALAEAFGRVPAAGDELHLQGWRLRVVHMRGRRVERVLVRPAVDDGPAAGVATEGDA